MMACPGLGGTFTRLFACVALLALAAVAQAAAPAIIPQPQRMVMGEGTFELHSGMRIAAPADARAQWIAAYLEGAIREQVGVALNVASATANGAIALRIDPSIRGDEAYRLDVTTSGITIAAADDRGLFWGVQTLRQLLPVRRPAVAAIPAVHIEDWPRYPWRGVMLDVSRHFFPVAFIERQIDLMSYYKLDVFHWHLTDDQGWRIRIKRYPRLTSVGAWRTDAGGERSDGFYTQEQIREVVAYARRRNVMVVPEIEMPGHSTAAIAAYPEISCSGKPAAVLAGRGGTRRVDCVTPATFSFLENVLDEVMSLFPAPYVHIGSDEVPGNAWSDCASCQELAKANGLDGEAGLHSYFVRRIQQYLARHGKTMIGWDELLDGGMDANAVVEVWHKDDAARALANGNRIILAGPFYLDHVAAPVDLRTLQDLYRADPLDQPMYLEHPRQALGGEAPLWSEMATPMNAMALLYPRSLALAEHFWNPAARDWDDFERRVAVQEAWLASRRVAYGASDQDLVAYRVSFDPLYRRWRLGADRGFDDMRIHYTLDGSEPTTGAPWFGKLFDFYHPETITVAPFRGGVQLAPSRTFRTVSNLALGDPVTFAAPPDPGFSGGPLTLTDGIVGTADMETPFHDGTWDGWQGVDMYASIDLAQPTIVRSVDARFLQYGSAGIRVPSYVWFEASDDGVHWRLVDSQAVQGGADNAHPAVRNVTFTAPTSFTTRYVRVIAAPGVPVGPGSPWLVSDEIIVR